MTRHSIDDRLSIAVPDDWERWDATDGVLFLAAAPDIGRDDLQPQIFVTRSSTENDTSLASLVANVAYLQSDPDSNLKSDAEVFAANCLQIAAITFDAPSHDWTFTNRQFFIVFDGQEYLVARKMLPEQADRWLAEFDSIVRTIDRLK